MERGERGPRGIVLNYNNFQRETIGENDQRYKYRYVSFLSSSNPRVPQVSWPKSLPLLLPPFCIFMFGRYLDTFLTPQLVPLRVVYSRYLLINILNP